MKISSQPYLSTTPSSEPTPGLMRHWKPLVRAGCYVVAALLVILYIDVLALKWIAGIVAAGLALRELWTLASTTLPPVMGAGPGGTRVFSEADTWDSSPLEVEEIFVEEDEELLVRKRKDLKESKPDQDDLVYKEHWFELVRGSKKPMLLALPLLTLAILPIVLAEISNRQQIVTWLVIVASIAGAVVAAGMLGPAWSRVLFRWLRQPALATLVIAGAYLASLRWGEARLMMVGGLMLFAFIPLMRMWARWHYARYIITTTDYRIECKPPWIFMITRIEEEVGLDDTGWAKTFQPPYAEALGWECGRVVVDTPVQGDTAFSENPHLIEKYGDMKAAINQRKRALRARKLAQD